MAFRYFLYLVLLLNAGAAFAQTTSDPATSTEATTTASSTSVEVPTSAPTTTMTIITSAPSTTTETTTSASSTTTGTVTSTPSTTTSTTSTTSQPSPTPVPAFKIHPIANTSKCLEVRGAVFANGTPVQIFDCNGTPAQNWNIAFGDTKVVLAGTGFCLDAGSTPGNGVGMKIWQCFDGLPAQDWFYTADLRVALANQGLCLDLTNGNLANANQVQTWQCTDNDLNQVWLLTN